MNRAIAYPVGAREAAVGWPRMRGEVDLQMLMAIAVGCILLLVSYFWFKDGQRFPAFLLLAGSLACFFSGVLMSHAEVKIGGGLIGGAAAIFVLIMLTVIAKSVDFVGPEEFKSKLPQENVALRKKLADKDQQLADIEAARDNRELHLQFNCDKRLTHQTALIGKVRADGLNAFFETERYRTLKDQGLWDKSTIYPDEEGVFYIPIGQLDANLQLDIGAPGRDPEQPGAGKKIVEINFRDGQPRIEVPVDGVIDLRCENIGRTDVSHLDDPYAG